MIQVMKNLNLLQKIVCCRQSNRKREIHQNNFIQFETLRIKSSLRDYSDAFILVTGDIIVAADKDADVAFKIVHHFLHAKQKLMMCLLMKQIIFILQCQLFRHIRKFIQLEID